MKELYLLVVFILILIVFESNTICTQTKYQTEFKYAIRLYSHAQYNKSILILDNLITDQKVDKKKFYEIFLYLAFNYLKINKKYLAEPALEELFKINPDYIMSNNKFSEEEIDFYNEMRGSLLGSLKINTLPDSAEVFINNRYYGKTPLNINNIFADDYEVNLVRGGYFLAKEFVSVFPQDTATLSQRLKRDDFIAVSKIITDPPGAEFYVGDAFKGYTPLFFDDIISGRYNVTIKKEGYDEFKQSREFYAHSLNEIKLQLKRKKDYFVYSELIPGLGQLIKGYKIHGIIFSSFFTGYMIYCIKNFPNAPKTYRHNLSKVGERILHPYSPYGFYYKYDYYIDSKKVTEEEYEKELANREKNERKWSEYKEKKWKMIIPGVSIYILNLIDTYIIMKNDQKRKDKNWVFEIDNENDQKKIMLSFKIMF